MKKLLAGGMMALLILTGCGEKSPPGGGVSGRTDPTKSTRPTTSTPTQALQEDATFKVVAPGGTTSIKQGDAKTVKISLDREKNFTHDVTLKIQSPKGVTVEPASPVIKGSEKDPEVEVKISAAPDAPVGEQTINITATPAKGKATEVAMRVKVEAK